MLISSKHGCLQLTESEQIAFEAELEKLYEKYYRIQRQARGIWASNQGCYVQTPAELNAWDSTYEETRYSGESRA